MLNANGSPNGTAEVAERLGPIGLGLQLPEAGEPAGEVIVPQVEAGQLVQRDALVEHGVGLTAEDLDGVTEVDQRLGEMAGVDALPPDMRLAAVGEVGDREGGVGRQRLSLRRGGGRHRPVRLSAPCYRPVRVTGLQRASGTGHAAVDHRTTMDRRSSSPGAEYGWPPPC